MRFLVQRVESADVTVDGQVIGKIGKGFLVFVGISNADTEGEQSDKKWVKAYSIADKMVKKLIGLRIFQDENGKTNLDLKSVGGQLLIISQFTLYADCRKGNRPSFINAAAPEAADEIYRYIIHKCKEEIDIVEEGSFGADMKISLLNDGPFTVLLDSQEISEPKNNSRKPSPSLTNS